MEITVNIKTFCGDYFQISIPSRESIDFYENQIIFLLQKIEEYNASYDKFLVCLYDSESGEDIKLCDQLKNGQEIFMVVSLIDVNIITYQHNEDKYIIEFCFCPSKSTLNYKSDILFFIYILSRELIIDNDNEEYENFDHFIEKKINKMVFTRGYCPKDFFITEAKRKWADTLEYISNLSSIE